MLSDLFKVKTKDFQSITEAAVGAERSILHFGLIAAVLCATYEGPLWAVPYRGGSTRWTQMLRPI